MPETKKENYLVPDYFYKEFKFIKPLVLFLIFITFILTLFDPTGPAIYSLLVLIAIVIFIKIGTKERAGYVVNIKLFTFFMIFFMVLLFSSTFFYYNILPRSLSYAIKPDCSQCFAIFQFGEKYIAKYYPNVPEISGEISLSIEHCADVCQLCTDCNISGKILEGDFQTYIFRNRIQNNGESIKFNYLGKPIFIEITRQNEKYTLVVPKPTLFESIILESKQNQLFLISGILLSIFSFFLFLFGVLKYILKLKIHLFEKKEPPKGVS